MTRKFNVMIPIGKYESNGQEKTKWFKIASLIEKQDGNFFIAFEDIVGNFLKPIFGYNWNLMASVFEQGDRNERAGSSQQGGVVEGGELPF